MKARQFSRFFWLGFLVPRTWSQMSMYFSLWIYSGGLFGLYVLTLLINIIVLAADSLLSTY